VAANTPASDGKLIYALFSSNDLVCLDLEGNLRWYRGLTHDHPTAANDVGMSSSPLVFGDTVVVQIENKGDSFAAGLDTTTGQTRWKQARQQELNWVSPTVLPGKTRDEDLVLLQSPARFSAHRPATGEEVWSHEAKCSPVPSAVASGGIVYVPASGLTALRYQRSSSEPLESRHAITVEIERVVAGQRQPGRLQQPRVCPQ
jgi:outer membrane protein assembly factor BamB